MPSQQFSGKSKEDLVIVARLSGLLGEEEAQRMSRTALARFLERAQAEAEAAQQRQAAVNAGADDAAAAPAATDTLVARTARKTGGRRRRTDIPENDQQDILSLAEGGAPAAEAAAPAEPVQPAVRPVARTRRASAKAAQAADTSAEPTAPAVEAPAAVEAAPAESAQPAVRVTRRAGGRKAAQAEPALAVQPIPVDFQPVAATEIVSAPTAMEQPAPAGDADQAPIADAAQAPAAETADDQAAVKPVAEPALINAFEPLEPTVAQAAAVAPAPETAAAPAASPELDSTPAAEPTAVETAAPDSPAAETAPIETVPSETVTAASASAGPAIAEPATAAVATGADARVERVHKRPGRPPKQPPTPPVAVRSPSAVSPAAQAATPAAQAATPAPQAATPAPQVVPVAPTPATPASRPGSAETPVRQQPRDGAPQAMPTSRTPGQVPTAGRHDRHVRLPGGPGAHHSFIPAHHTLTTPANAPDEERSETGEPRSDAREGMRQDGASARGDSFQERSSSGQGERSYAGGAQPAQQGGQEFGRNQYQGQGQEQGAPFQQRGQIYNASGKIVRPTGDGYTEVETAPEGEGQHGQPVQGRFEGEAGKSRRPFVETGEMVSGVLEIMPDGYGFLRKDNYLQGSKDIYVPPQYIRRFNLRQGDLVAGPGKVQRETDRYQALLYIKEVNGLPPERMIRRPNFDKLTPIYPDERFVLETARNELSTRIIDLVAPIGKGQRGMIVSPPKAGKTILLQKIANAISINNPDVKLIVLLIDERPEEVTDMQRSINGEVVYSTFDKTPENHVKVTELVLERAMRLVELNQDVVILLDSITRMGRAYNLTINPTGRTLSGGLDPGALYGPKRFFGAARNIEGGGSLTIIATALIDTGSRMDEVIFEEFKGTGNMEVYLDRKLSEKRIFPAIDINRSGTRREELLLTTKELDAVWSIRKAFSQLDTSAVTEMIINLLMKTNNNQHFVSSINVSLNDKNVFEAMRGSRPGQAQNGHA